MTRLISLPLCAVPVPLFCLALLVGCASKSDTVTVTAEKPVLRYSSETLEVAEQSWPTIVRSQGSLYPDEVATLGVKVDGRVIEVHVDVGDIVETGESLLTIYQNDFRLRVEQAEAQVLQARSAVGLRPEDPIENLAPVNAPPVREQRALWDEATTNLNRARDLMRQGALVQAELDQVASIERVAAARYDSAINSVREKIANISVQQALLDLAQEELDNTTLKAPFDAVVQSRLIAPGSYVKVGDPLFQLVRIEKLRFRGNVPERLSQAVQLGQNVELRIESVFEPRNSQVTRISPFLDLNNRSLQFEANVDNTDRRLRAGLFANAFVIVNPEARAIVVPASAIVQFAGTEKVWRVVNGEVSEQPVLLGERREDEVQILSGLSVGDIILKNAERGRRGVLIAEESVTAAAPGS